MKTKTDITHIWSSYIWKKKKIYIFDPYLIPYKNNFQKDYTSEAKINK